ncbi:uncharacterized protein J3D65DRAFT_473022 [Phyllosticta citribraziliensis]|uniref:Secreted protein n=1 Tax=Phyllosticta citribraziliensis TaxID=989973 RepID=A0ABR1LHE9_9PEZI
MRRQAKRSSLSLVSALLCSALLCSHPPPISAVLRPSPPPCRPSVENLFVCLSTALSAQGKARQSRLAMLT